MKHAVVFLALVAASASAAEPLQWKSGPLVLRPTGYLQADGRAFPGWEVEPGLRSDALDVRRLRAGLELTLGVVSGEVGVDGGDLANDLLGDDTHPAFTPRQHLKNAYLEVALGKRHFLRAGHTKLPVSREFLTSVAKTDFVERSMAVTALAPNRDWGVLLGGKLPLAQGASYLVGVFAGDGWAEASRAETTGAGRFVLEPFKDLQIGVSGSLGTVQAAPEGPAAEGKGLRGRTASGFSFFRRMFVDGTRRRAGGDVQYEKGAITLRAELLHARDERRGQGSRFEDLPTISGFGGYATAIWRVHGPRGKKDKAHGRAPLDLAVRVESMSFDDDGPGLDFEGIGNRTSNVRPQSSRALSAGVSYMPRSWVRLMGDLFLERYGDALLAPESGRKGTYVTLIGRLQIEVP
jgi:hypothetical protein